MAQNDSQNGFVRFLRECFIIDFDKPLSIKNQFTIMFVTLFISVALFSGVYGISVLSHPLDIAEAAAASDESSDSSAKKNQVSEPEIKPAVLLKKMTSITRSAEQIHDGYLILVNKDNSCYHNGENVISLLGDNVKSDSYMVTDDSVRLDEGIVDNVNAMFDDFYSIYGENSVIMACGFRSEELQQELFDDEINSKGETEGEMWVAPPGYSEHQTGYAFDLDLLLEEGTSGIDYDGQGIYSWINENSSQYGFILRYPEGKDDITGYEYEPWHFRYVGVPEALYITEHGLTLEEYIKTVQAHNVNDPILIKDRGDGEKMWCTYFVPADKDGGDTKVPVPVEYDYTVSGDNISGFIVTVRLK